MQRLFDICVEGLEIVVGLPAILTRLDPKIGKVEDDLQFRRSLDNAEFVQNERERGFPLLHAYTLVSVWGALETGIEDMLVGILLNEPEVLASDELAKIKGPHLSF
jgi:hypothetical protein